jgi:hypothetical protein
MKMAGCLAAVAGIACTTTKLVERDGCWVKQTSRTMGSSTEELGFCTRPASPPAEDRLARMLQECMAQADQRWQNQAITAWNHNQPLPAQPDDAAMVKTCMTQAANAIGMESQNQALQSRVAELSQDREALKSQSDRDREQMQQSNDKMIEALGEAAKRPTPNATATATVKSESDLKTPQTPATTVVGFAPMMAAPAPAPVIHRTNSCAPRKTDAKQFAEKDPPACPMPGTPPAG